MRSTQGRGRVRGEGRARGEGQAGDGPVLVTDTGEDREIIVNINDSIVCLNPTCMYVCVDMNN